MLETGKDIINNFEILLSRRGNFENVFRDISDDILGLRHFNMTHSIGLQRFKVIYDTTALSAGMLLASTLNGLLTNPGAPFHRSVVPAGIRELGRNNDYLVHIDEEIDKFYKEARHGFPTASTEWYIDYVFFGTAGMYTADVPGVGPVDFARPLGELILDESQNDLVDTVYRVHTRTARQFVQEFGRDAHQPTTDELDKGSNRPIEMIHLTHPRSDIQSGPYKRGKKWRSVHIMKEDGTIVKESGMHGDPWQVGRWGKEAGEMYGRGPGWQALPDAQTASEMRRILLETGQKHLDPALLVPDDGFLTQIDTSPRTLTVYRAGAIDKDGIREFPSGQGSPVSDQAILATQNQIKERFYAHLLQLFDTPMPTATQSLELESKAARILVAVVSRAAAEFVNKSLNRKFDIAARHGMFDRAPDTLEGVPIGIQYIGPVMKAQSQMETRATLNTYAAAGQIAQASGDMSVFDNFRDDINIRRIAEAEGMNLGGLESPDAIMEMRRIRAEAEQMQRQMDQLGEGASAMGKALPALAKMTQAQQPEMAA